MKRVHAILLAPPPPLFCFHSVVACKMVSNTRILRATRKIVEGDIAGEDNFYEDFEVCA